MTLYTWSQTAATNSNADVTSPWPEGMAPSQVNDSARALMAAAAKFRDDNSGVIVTGGASTAYTAANFQGWSALVDGYTISVQFHVTNGASPTLNISSSGAKPILLATSTVPVAATILAGSTHKLTYDLTLDSWILHGYVLTLPELVTGTKVLFQQTAAPTGWTKDTTHNDKTLRVVSGAASSGGTVAFSTAFASKTVAGTVGGTAITEAQMPLHGHPWRFATTPDTSSGGIVLGGANQANKAAFTGTPTATLGEQIGGTGGGATHTHSFTGTAIDMAVQYVDIIIATKN